MHYVSTRGEAGEFSAAEAIKHGLAPDGGLFVPTETPAPPKPDILTGQDYRQRAAAIMAPFLAGYTAGELAGYVNAAYKETRFDHPDIAPLHRLDKGLFCLELWHGPTCAFKDMALQILPHLLTGALQKTGDQSEVVILVATSGDTGKAALEGFRDVPGTRVIVFYPAEGVSEMQRRQMVTQEGNNVHVAAVRGNFDDAQAGVKALFADRSLAADLAAGGYTLSSANSINWGRLAPQIAYYFSAYLDLLRGGLIRPGEKVNFAVPTGNFGNILAGYYASQMGLPVHRLICAANQNHVLTDFINTGVYDRNRPFHRTISPSMDILISSNLERLLFALSGGDTHRVRSWMRQLQETGRYQVDRDISGVVQELFWSDFTGEKETIDTIRETFAEHRYLLDPHTAVAMAACHRYRESTGDLAKTVLVSTASPFKFNASVARAVLDPAAVSGGSEFNLLEALAGIAKRPVPAGLAGLAQKEVRHTLVVDRDQMKERLLLFLR
jgi:threonine synthase